MSERDPEAGSFRALFERELPWVWTVLRRLGVPAADRPDVAHDVFIAIYKHLSDYDPARPLRPWLFAFVYRTARDRKARAAGRYEVSCADIDEPEDGTRPIDEVLGMRMLLARALEQLPEHQRLLLVMHEIEGFSGAEIATCLGEPAQTIYSRLRVAREDLTRNVRRLTGRRGAA